MRRLFVILAALMLVTVGCNNFLDTPEQGAIVPGASVPLSGRLATGVKAGGVLTVNGTVVPVAADKTWSTSIPATPGSYTTTIHVGYTDPDGLYSEQRRTIVTGPKLDRGEFAPDGVGMKFTNTGLGQLGPMIQDLAGGAFDIGPMLMSQHPLFTTSQSGINATGEATEGVLGDVAITTSATDGGVAAHIVAKDLFVGINMDLTGLISTTCYLEVRVPESLIDATFSLSPLAADPSKVDVNLLGTPTVSTPVVTHQFMSGQCDPNSALGPLINAVAGSSIQSTVNSAFVSALSNQGDVKSPLATAIQDALGGVSIAGPVGDAVQSTLDAPFTQINTDSSGIDFRSNARFTTNIGTEANQCPLVPGAPTLPATYDVPGDYPTLGATSPDGHDYGLALTVSASAFNQLLGSMTECGSLNSAIDQIAVGDQTLPVNSTILSLLVPAFGTGLPANTPMRIVVTPNYAPFLTAETGPSGEPAELMLADLNIDFVEVANAKSWLKLSVDAPLGFDLAYDAVTSSLQPVLTPPTAEDVVARVQTNAIGADEAGVTAVFPGLFPSFVEPVTSTFQAFPLPSFMGLNLDIAQIARQGNSFVLYTNLDATPQTHLANVQITDQSDANDVLDGVFNTREWRHELRKRTSSSSVSVAFKGVLGAHACCTVTYAEQYAAAGYQVEFDVVPANGDTWHLDLAQAVNGAHSHIDSNSGGARSQIRTVFTGQVSLDNGATWQNFDADVGPNMWESWGMGYDYRPFNASGSRTLSGTAPAHVIVRYHVNMWVQSQSKVVPALVGDQIAIRFGLNTSIANNYTAGRYPGMGSRDITQDGWFGNVTLTTTPAP